MTNRIIKFRAWDKNTSTMWETKDLYLQSDMVILMQFTGLLDKNRKEIYEGDIVRMLYTDWSDEEKDKDNGEVQWKEDRWMLNFGKGRFGGEDFGTLHPGAHGYMEIIGNKWENPDLLSPKPTGI